MDCQTCDDLLAGYRLSVTLFKNAVQNIPGTAEDSTLALQQADRLKMKSREANDCSDGPFAAGSRYKQARFFIALQLSLTRQERQLFFNRLALLKPRGKRAQQFQVVPLGGAPALDTPSGALRQRESAPTRQPKEFAWTNGTEGFQIAYKSAPRQRILEACWYWT